VPDQLVILLGAPGSGKGTQAARLAPAIRYVHVATGDLFRDNVKHATPLGLKAKGFMDAGQLVPDELVLDMLFERLARPDCARGVILDGFPRTLPQAEALRARLGAQVPHVVHIQVGDAELLERAAGRVVCKGCGNVQNTKSAPPKVAGKCDRCGGELARRPDDERSVVEERLRVYRRQTAPLVDFYRAPGAGSYREIAGSGSPDEVHRALLAIAMPRGGPGATGAPAAARPSAPHAPRGPREHRRTS
jgi:adenylate kinase